MKLSREQFGPSVPFLPAPSPPLTLDMGEFKEAGEHPAIASPLPAASVASPILPPLSPMLFSLAAAGVSSSYCSYPHCLAPIWCIPHN